MNTIFSKRRMTRLMAAVVAMVAVLFTSCSKAYRNAIPEDAFVVAELDMAKLVTDADLMSHKDELKKLFLDEIGSDDETRQIANLADDPTRLGLNFMQPAYAFMLSNNNPYVFLLMAVSDGDKLSTFLEGVDVDVESSDNVNFVVVDGEVMGAYNDDAFLFGSAQGKGLYRQLLSQKKEDSFFHSSEAKVLDNYKGAAKMFISFGNMPSELRRELNEEWDDMRLQTTDLIEGFLTNGNLLFGINTTKGHVSMDFKVGGLPEDAMEQFASAKVDKEVLRYISDRSLLGFALFNIDGSSIVDGIKKIIPSERLRGHDEQMILGALNAIKGTGCVAAMGEDIDEIDATVILPVAKAKMDNALGDIARELSGELSYTGNDEYTAISTDGDYSLRAQGSVDYADADSYYAYAYADVDKLCDLCYSFAGEFRSSRESKFFNKCINSARRIDHLELVMSEPDEVSFVAVMSDDDRNALAIIVDEMIAVYRAAVDL